MHLSGSRATVPREIRGNYKLLAIHSGPYGSPSHLFYDLGLVASSPGTVQGRKQHRVGSAFLWRFPGCSCGMGDLSAPLQAWRMTGASYCSSLGMELGSQDDIGAQRSLGPGCQEGPVQ